MSNSKFYQGLCFYFLLSTDLRVGEVDPAPPGVPGAGDGCPRVRALSVHLQPTILVVLVSLSFESRYLNFRNRTISSSLSTLLEDVNGFELHKHHGQGILL